MVHMIPCTVMALDIWYFRYPTVAPRLVSLC